MSYTRRSMSVLHIIAQHSALVYPPRHKCGSTRVTTDEASAFLFLKQPTGEITLHIAVASSPAAEEASPSATVTVAVITESLFALRCARLPQQSHRSYLLLHDAAIQ